MNTPNRLNKTPATMVPIAVPSPSIIWAPNPQFHSGSRTDACSEATPIPSRIAIMTQLNTHVNRCLGG